MSGTATMAPERRVVATPRADRVDTVFLLISAMVVVDTIGAVAIAGGEAFTWLVVLFATFFVPSALISAELGAAMPEQGGVYVWVRRAFGRFPAALTSLLYWAGTPMWLGGSITAIALSVHEQFVGDLGPGGRYAFAALFIGVATFAAVVPLRFGKWVPSSGAIGQTVLLGFFTVTVAIYGASSGIHGIAVGDLSPSTAGFIAVAPILLYSFVGIELPTAAAGEMRNPRRDIPASIGRAGLAQALMYGIPVLAVLIVLPSEQISSLRGLLDAMRTVFSVYGGTVDADGTVVLTGAGQVIGTVTGLIFIWVLLASGSAWIIGAGRAQAAACLDGAGPGCSGARRRAAGCRSSWAGRPGWWRSSSPSSSLAVTQRRRPGLLLGDADDLDLPDRARLSDDLPRVPRPPPCRTRPRPSVPGARWGVGATVPRCWRPGGHCSPPRACCGPASAPPSPTVTCRQRSPVTGPASRCSSSPRSSWSSSRRRRSPGASRAACTRAERQSSVSGSRPCCMAYSAAAARLVTAILV